MESLVKEGSIGSVLYNSKIITEDDIRRALEEQKRSGCRIGEALVRLGIVTQEDIDWALSNQLDIPYVRLNEQTIDSDAIKLVPRSIARRFNLIPIIKSGDELHIAIADPLDRDAIDEVEKITGCRAIVSMPVIRELTEMLNHFYGASHDDVSFGFSSCSFPEGILEKINMDSSGTRMLDYLILFFLQNGIDTISLQPTAEDVRVSTRSGRSFREIGRFPLSSYPELLSYIRRLVRVDNSGELATEGKVVYRFRESDVVLKVSMMTAMEGDCITIRLWSTQTFPETLGSMGLDRSTEANFRSLAGIDRGMVLFASWNMHERQRLMDLYLDEAETSDKNVLLIGEGIGKGKKCYPRIPIHDGRPEFVEGIIADLESHDPDVIFIEEATASRPFLAAWRAAMRRRVVVAGISCSGLAGAFDYLISERHFNHSLMAGIRGIVSCNGVRTLCPHCRDSSPSDGRDSDIHFDGIYYRGKGCAVCGYSGLNGMKYLLDVVAVDSRFRETFDSARDCSELINYLAGIGHGNLEEQLVDLLRKGEISPEEYTAAGLQF